MGQQAFGKACLEEILKTGKDKVVAVYCAPDKESNPLDPIKEYALEKGLPIVQPPNFKSTEVLDEIRSFNPENFVGKPDVDWDTNFVFVVGNYNTKSGDWNKLGQAFMNWQTKPGVEKGLQLGGGYSVHFSGSSYDVQVFQGFANFVDFAKSVTTDSLADSTFAPDFWSEVDGDHEDQIYVHIGHLVNGKFDLAGPNR